MNALDRLDVIFELIEKGTRKDCYKAMALTLALLARLIYNYTFEKE